MLEERGVKCRRREGRNDFMRNSVAIRRCLRSTFPCRWVTRFEMINKISQNLHTKCCCGPRRGRTRCGPQPDELMNVPADFPTRRRNRARRRDQADASGLSRHDLVTRGHCDLVGFAQKKSWFGILLCFAAGGGRSGTLEDRMKIRWRRTDHAEGAGSVETREDAYGL